MTLLALEWLTPTTGLIVASCVVPPLVALYFLKLRRKAAVIPSTLLWKRSVEDLRANAPFQRLRPNLLLFLQLLLLGFVAFALAQPRMDIGGAAGGRTVLLIDRSASMGATDLAKDKTRLQVAKEQAVERVEKQFAGGLFSGAPGEMMVVAFANDAEVVQPFTRSKAELLRAIDRIQPTDGGSKLHEALALARAYTTVTNPDDPKATLSSPASYELFSDGRITDLADEALRPEEELAFRVIGRADAVNLGIEGIAAERSSADPGLMQVFVTLRNDGPEAVETEVQLAVDGKVRTVLPKPVQVPAGAVDPATQRWKPGLQRVMFPPLIQPRAGAVTVELLRPDQLPVDNLADVAIAAPRRLHVALVGNLDFATRNVMTALPVEKVEQLTAEEYAQRAGTAGASDLDVVVAPAAALPSPLPPGRYLIFGVPAGLEGLNPFGEKQSLSVRSQRGDHPVLRAVNLDDLFVSKATAVAPASDVEVLVEAADTPLVSLVRRGPVQALVVGFDPLDSNWPFQRGFVTFTANAAEWLGSMDQAAVQEEHRPGDALTARVPPNARAVQMTAPGGAVTQLTPRDGVVSFGPVERAGVYTLTWAADQGEDRRVFAVNPAPGEGYIAAADQVTLGTTTVAGQRTGGSILSDLWPFALAAAIVLLVVEWWVYHRKHWIRRSAVQPKAAPIIRA